MNALNRRGTAIQKLCDRNRFCVCVNANDLSENTVEVGILNRIRGLGSEKNEKTCRQATKISFN